MWQQSEQGPVSDKKQQSCLKVAGLTQTHESVSVIFNCEAVLKMVIWF